MDNIWQSPAEEWEPQGQGSIATTRRHEPEVPDPCSKVAEFLTLLHLADPDTRR